MSWVVLFKGDEGGTNVNQSVGIAGNGDLVLEGSDVGEAPRAIWKSFEYEYWLTVRVEHKKRVLELLSEGEPPLVDAALDADEELIGRIERRFAGTASAFSRFHEWCAEKEIPAEFFSWFSPD